MSSIEEKTNIENNEKNFFKQISSERISIFDNNNFFSIKNKNIKQKISSYNKVEIQNNSNLEEDDYNFSTYNKSISNDEIFTNKKKEDIIHSRYNTISSFKSLNSIKKKLSQKYINIININSINENSILNLSYEENIYRNPLFFANPIFLNEEKSRNNLIKITNNFYSIHNERINNIKKAVKFKRLGKSLSKNIMTNSNKLNVKKINITNNNYNINKKSKFSKKKNKNSKKLKRSIVPIHGRHVTQYINSNNLQNKILKIENMSNINYKRYKDINNKIPNNSNYKMIDGFIININNNKNNLTEKDKEILKKNMENNKPLIKDDLINNKNIDKNLIRNDLKMKNNQVNFINIKKNSSNDLKTIIIPHSRRDSNKNMRTIYKTKNREGSGFNKIVKKRIILEEEYMISPIGEKRLLSVKRLDDEENSNSNLLDKYFKKEKKENLVQSNYFRNTINNSLFSSIFQETSKERNFYTTNLKYLAQDLSNLNIINNNDFSLSNKRKNKNIIISTSRINTKNNLINYNLFKKPKEELNNIKENLNGNEQTLDLKINSELNNKEVHFKKKLFYNKINFLKEKNLNKFNKCNNNSFKNINNKISRHTNFLNGNRTTMNYFEDKNKYFNENSKNIYDSISLTKEQPLAIYHNKELNKNSNFIINNNHNCPNLVNIVFINNEEKSNQIHKYKSNNNNGINKYLINKRISIPQPKLSSSINRTNYRFHEVKLMSLDNSQGIKSSGYFNKDNKKILHTNNSNSYFEIKNNKINNNIYSSFGNLNKLNINNSKKYFDGIKYNYCGNIYKNDNSRQISQKILFF